jgi:hypothetical protein
MPSRNRRRGFTLIEQRVLAPIITILAVILCPVFSQAREKAHTENPDEFWSSRVEPLLDKQCLKCHAGVRQRGGLDLRSLETMLRGGDSGPAIIPGRPDESRIVQFVSPKSAVHMPPDNTKQLSAADISILQTWIAQLPVPKSKLASGASTNTSWVPEYLEDYRRSRQSHEIPPAKLSASATINWFLQTDWQRDKIEPAHLCDDLAFARRIYLDVAGRIPSKDELKQFLADSRSDKRQRLVARLIASDDYPRHMREVFDTVLMGRPTDNNARQRAERGWNAFLEESFRANRPWNETVRDILVARSTDGPGRGAVWFLAERNNSHQAIAEAVAPVVFGVQIKCAQCHNHPLAWEIEQRHYWGLVAAFNRSKNVDTETGPGVAESAIGGFINFANLKKESQPAALVFLNGKSVPERIPAPDAKEVDSPDLYLVPPAKNGQKAHSPAVPRFSRREAFAEAVTRNNPLLARAFVNRMWADLMGRGIVQPADQIDSRHRPSHPELLEWLTHDFEQSGYDIKRLVQNIVLSRAYQLDSKPSGKTTPRPESFARALEKPLSAEQLLHSLWIATGNNNLSNKLSNKLSDKTDLDKTGGKSAAEWERTFATTFPDLMPDTYSPSLQQALFLSNSPILDGLLQPAPGSTTAKLIALGSNETRVREAFSTVLGRSPDAAELQRCQSILNAQSPQKGVRNLLWALLTCAEFQVNH